MRTVGLGFENSDRANFVAGEPVWLTSASAPGGRVLNPAAFQAPADGQNGNLGRDVLTGPGLFQLDANVRRKFYLYRSLLMEGILSAFNLPNHPSFSKPGWVSGKRSVWSGQFDGESDAWLREPNDRCNSVVPERWTEDGGVEFAV